MYEFCSKEKEFWRSVSERLKSVNVPHDRLRYLNSESAFDAVVRELATVLSDISEDGSSDISNKIIALKRNNFTSIQNRWLWSGHGFIEALIGCISEYGHETASAFYSYIRGEPLNNYQAKEHFQGYVLGYEFCQGDSNIKSRADSERSSIEMLRERFLTETDRIFSETDAEVRAFKEWSDESKTQVQLQLEEHRDALTKHVQQHNDELAKQQAEQKSIFDTQIREWEGAISILAQTYNDKLRLEAPIMYWKRAAKRYGIQGGLWAVALVFLVVAGVYYFRDFFLAWLGGEHLPFSLATVQGVVIFGSIAALFAFLMRVLSRLAFSSFHLMRDAEEREHLTYLYLSLRHESAADERARDIVLQALFSRSETGLLANESGPTMPSITEVVSSAVKVKT